MIFCYFLFNYLEFPVLPVSHYLLLVVNLIVSSGDLGAVRGLGGKKGGQVTYKEEKLSRGCPKEEGEKLLKRVSFEEKLLKVVSYKGEEVIKGSVFSEVVQGGVYEKLLS